MCSSGAAVRAAVGPGHQPTGGGESAAQDHAAGQPGQPPCTDGHAGLTHLLCLQVRTVPHDNTKCGQENGGDGVFQCVEGWGVGAVFAE